MPSPLNLPSTKPLEGAGKELVAAFSQIGKSLLDLGKIADAAAPSLSIFTESLKKLGTIALEAGRGAVSLATDAMKKLGSVVGSAFGGLGGVVGQALGRVTSTAASAIGGLAAGLGKLAGGAGLAVTAVIGIGEAMAGMVAKANPALLLQFQLALDDLTAVMGQALAPIFQVIIGIVRMAADTLKTFASTIGGAIATAIKPFAAILGVVFEVVGRLGQAVGRVFEKLAPAISTVGELFLALYEAVQPLLDLVVDVLGGALEAAVGGLASVLNMAIPYVTAFARVVGDLVNRFAKWVREMLALIGIDLPDNSGTKPGSSVNQAVRSTSIGSVESLQSQAFQKAFSLGGAASTPEQKTASAAEAIKARADQIYEEIKAFPARIGQYFLDLPGRLAKAIADGAKAAVQLGTTPEGRGALGAAASQLPGVNVGVSAYNYVERQAKKPGIAGFTSLNPFS